MNITFFNKEYIIRRFSEQSIVKGYVTSPISDFKASLHIHPPSEDTINALPEGERLIKRLEGHGSIELISANQDTGIKGDLLYYHGKWYECVSSVEYDHTFLSHWNYKFVIVPNDASRTVDTYPPEEVVENETEGS